METIRMFFTILRVMFEWVFVLAILFGTIYEIYYQFIYYHVLAIVPIAFPLLVLLVWLYVKAESLIKKRKDQYSKGDMP